MKPRFANELDVARLPDGRWVLRQALVYWSARAGKIVVPAGFRTDFASVPRLPLVYLLAGDTAHAAAVVHDWLYQEQFLSRRLADAVLYEASGCSVPAEPRWRRWIIWSGVRAFGWVAWKRSRSGG